MTKQFSVSQLKDEVSIYDEFVDIPVTVQGKEYIVKMFPYFKPEGIRDLVNEMIDFFKASETEKLMIPHMKLHSGSINILPNLTKLTKSRIIIIYPGCHTLINN